MKFILQAVVHVEVRSGLVEQCQSGSEKDVCPRTIISHT